jgi:hypothetical protein
MQADRRQIFIANLFEPKMPDEQRNAIVEFLQNPEEKSFYPF